MHRRHRGRREGWWLLCPSQPDPPPLNFDAGQAHSAGGRPGKLLSPARRRACIEQVRAQLHVSERPACAARGQHRSTQRKIPRGREDEERLTADIIELARQYGLDPPRSSSGLKPRSAAEPLRGVLSYLLKAREGQAAPADSEQFRSVRNAGELHQAVARFFAAKADAAEPPLAE
jgi:hypothetical protein